MIACNSVSVKYTIFFKFKWWVQFGVQIKNHSSHSPNQIFKFRIWIHPTPKDSKLSLYGLDCSTNNLNDCGCWCYLLLLLFLLLLFPIVTVVIVTVAVAVTIFALDCKFYCHCHHYLFAVAGADAGAVCAAVTVVAVVVSSIGFGQVIICTLWALAAIIPCLRNASQRSVIWGNLFSAICTQEQYCIFQPNSRLLQAKCSWVYIIENKYAHST